MALKLLTLPSRHLAVSVPLAMLIGLVTGLVANVPQSPALIMPAVLLLIYPIMIGIPWQQVAKLEPVRLVLLATVLNFVLIPALAWGLGWWLLAEQPSLMAGLMIASLLPTSGMTISWTMLSGGNVPAAVRITVISLVLGSLLMPLYLLGMLGQVVPVDLKLMLARIGMTVILPMLLGAVTYSFLRKRYTQEEFQSQIKPKLMPVSVWAMLYVIFMSAATRAQHLLSDPEALVTGLLTLLLFYLANFAVSTLAGRWFLDSADAYTLVYTTVLRNLSIALGMALALYGAQAAFLVSLAFIVQVQGAVWYDRAAKRFRFFGQPAPLPATAVGND